MQKIFSSLGIMTGLLLVAGFIYVAIIDIPVEQHTIHKIIPQSQYIGNDK